MSTNLVHFMTFIGVSASQVERSCNELLARRVAQGEPIFGTGDWSRKDERAIDRLSKTLLGAARNLPVTYYAQYLDSWTIGLERFSILKWPRRKRRILCGRSHELAFYSSKYARHYTQEIARKRRMKSYPNQTEDRWFVDHLNEALQQGAWLRAKYIVVAITECIGGSRLDDEIRAALTIPMKALE